MLSSRPGPSHGIDVCIYIVCLSLCLSVCLFLYVSLCVSLCPRRTSLAHYIPSANLGPLGTLCHPWTRPVKIFFLRRHKTVNIVQKNIVEEESNPAFLAQALILLSRNDSSKKYVDEIIAKFDSQSLEENSTNILRFFSEELIDSTIKLPPIKDILNHEFQKGKTIIYSFHRKNRIHPGLTVIKNPYGKFVRNADSSLFSIQQLAYSVSNMPW